MQFWMTIWTYANHHSWVSYLLRLKCRKTAVWRYWHNCAMQGKNHWCCTKSGVYILCLTQTTRIHLPYTQHTSQVNIWKFSAVQIHSYAVRSAGQSTVLCPFWCWGHSLNASARWDTIRHHVSRRYVSDGAPKLSYSVSSSHYYLGIHTTVEMFSSNTDQVLTFKMIEATNWATTIERPF